MKTLTLVIFGATGNLYADKLAKALFLLFQQNDVLPRDFRIVAFARKDLSTKAFQDLTKEYILKRGEVDINKLDEFLSHIEYFKGDFSNISDFVNFKNYLSPTTDDLLIFHLATASGLYEKIFENIATSGISTSNQEFKILIEKPFGKDELDAKHLENVLSQVFKEEQIFHVDHYLAKETAQNILNLKLDITSVKKIKVIFHESNIVGSRGASYDVVGAFRDVGQNHMLQLLALATMDKSAISDTESIRSSRLKALNNLAIDYSHQITRAQYENYHLESGASSNSQAETFFRVFLHSKNLNFSDTLFELEGGKGLIDMGSDITTTTVSVQIYFKNGETTKYKEFKIQPVEGTVYESYIKVYNDVLRGDQTDFPSIEEIIAEWRLTDELLEKWKDIPLVFYKQGSKAEDIN